LSERFNDILLSLTLLSINFRIKKLTNKGNHMNVLLQNPYKKYPGLTFRAQEILFMLEEMARHNINGEGEVQRLSHFLHVRTPPDFSRLNSDGTGIIKFVDGSIVEIYVARQSKIGNPDWPVYHSLKDKDGKVFVSTLWPESDLQAKEDNLLQSMQLNLVGIREAWSYK